MGIHGHNIIITIIDSIIIQKKQDGAWISVEYYRSLISNTCHN